MKSVEKTEGLRDWSLPIPPPIQGKGRRLRPAVAWVLAVGLAPAAAGAVRLAPETVRAWEEYRRGAESGVEGRRMRPEMMARARGGEIVVEGEGARSVTGGLIHDWTALVFIANARLADVVAVVEDYDGYSRVYAGDVVEARTISREPGRDRFRMRLRRRALLVTAVFDTEHEARTVAAGEGRWVSVVRSTRIEEVENAGGDRERRLEAGVGRGFLWRSQSTTLVEEGDGGVYVEMRTLALSRDVPAAVAWLVDPLLARLPRQLLRGTLERTRAAVILGIGGLGRVRGRHG